MNKDSIQQNEPARSEDLSFLQHLTTNKHYALSPSERERLALAGEVLSRADGLIISLGGKAGRLGECIVGTALLEAALLALISIGKVGIPVHIIVDETAVKLFAQRCYEEKYWPGIHITGVFIDHMPELVETLSLQMPGKHILVLDFNGANDGMPSMQIREYRNAGDNPHGDQPREIIALEHLFRMGIRNYAERGPERRYADFIENLFHLPEGSIDGFEAQPTLRLTEDEARYRELIKQWHLDSNAIRIVCFFQSVVVAKCYCYWDEILQELSAYFAENFPAKKLEFFIACGPDEQLPDGCKQQDLEEEFSHFTGVANNAHMLIQATPSLLDLALLLKHTDLVLANDTGPSHIAGALHIPTVVPYLPGNIYSRRIWSSSLWHHGITLEPNPFSFYQIEAAILWNKVDIINSIPVRMLVQQAISILTAEPPQMPMC